MNQRTGKYILTLIWEVLQSSLIKNMKAETGEQVDTPVFTSLILSALVPSTHICFSPLRSRNKNLREKKKKTIFLSTTWLDSADFVGN